MTTPSLREIFHNGLWRQNAGLAQLLGLCPILAEKAGSQPFQNRRQLLAVLAAR